MSGYRVRQVRKYIVLVWIAVFLISYVWVVSPAAPSQTTTVQQLVAQAFDVPYLSSVVKFGTKNSAGNHEIKIVENLRGLAQQRDHAIVAYRVSRGRNILYFCCPGSTLLNDYVGKSNEPFIQMEGIDFSLLIEKNANAPPLCSDKML